ncbi:hypothetical protein V8B97DRAFT_1496043 [Scleroderma yunnanense]
MTALTLPSVPHYNAPPPTKADLDYADLSIIDLSKTDSPEGRAALACQVRDALLAHGFFYVINHGYPGSRDRMFDIADVPFEGVSDEEKQLYSAIDQETGWYHAYKLRESWRIAAGVRDQFEFINIDRDPSKQGHPEALQSFLPEIKEFASFNHYDVLFPILKLIALSLELPEDAFVNIHQSNGLGEAFVRFSKYHPHSMEDGEKSQNLWLQGHTDSGSITILWSQPVAGLQILGTDSKWRWVKYVEDALVVNAGDVMDFLTGGYYKATIHRVIRPPLDQQQLTRLCVFYFVMADGDVKLVPFRDSPVLQRVGIHPRCDDTVAPTMLEWRRARANGYAQMEFKRVDEEIVNGVVVKHYR